MNLRILLVDDEPLARASLRKMLEAESGIQIIGEASNGVEAVELIGDLQPDLVFLDIEMPGLNGLEVLEQLSEPVAAIFITAYNEYAVRAFDANAIDYLLKPIKAERLRLAVARAFERMPTPMPAARFDKVLEAAGLRTGPVKRLAVRRGKRIVIVPLREILRIEIEDKLVFAHTAQEKLLVEKTIGQLEEMLEPAGFLRISRGELVNQEVVRELMPWFSGTWRVKLSNGEERDVSRERAKTLKEAMGVE